MQLLFSHMNWVERSNAIDKLLTDDMACKAEPLGQGLEGIVVKVCDQDGACYALKIWNEYSNPNIKVQYDVLHKLSEQKLPVSYPFGYGKNNQNQSFLLTSYDGMPLTSLDQDKLIQIVQFLIALHSMNTNDFNDITLPTYHFHSYFFPNIEQHQDLNSSLLQLLEKVEFMHSHIIHGDFHFNNLVDHNGKLTIIDWTNIQLGDNRYDFAWSYLLQKLYVSEQIASSFYHTYLRHINIDKEDLAIFEAIACIRWILLSRSDDVPLILQTKKKISAIISQNVYLKQAKLIGFEFS